MSSTSSSPYIGEQIRLKVDIGPALKKGAIGVCMSDVSGMYPNSADSQYPLCVVFTGLGRPTTYYQPVPNVDPASVPHHNAVALRLREVELV